MAAVVIDDNEIALNGVYYPLARPVQSVLASIYPRKVVIGDTSKDSQLYSSITSWSDWRGGVGLERMRGAADVNRAWYSSLQMRYNNHLVLPGLATVTAAATETLTGPTIAAINQLGSYIYAAWNGSVSEASGIFKYTEASDTWGSVLNEPPDRVTDSVVFTDAGGTTYLVFAHYDSGGSGYTYTSNGADYTADGTDTQFVTVWDDRLWGISNAGQLWYAYTIGTETDDCKLPMPDGSVTALFVARNAAGTPIIYAATHDGLFAHDAENSRFIETQMTFPTHPDNGKGTTKWRDSVYVPSGLGIYKYINGNNAAVITPVGPDRDDGLPATSRGTVKMLAGTHNELLAGIDATTAPVSVGPTDVPHANWAGNPGSGSEVIDPTTGFSSIMGYNEMGWEFKWVGGTSGKAIDSIHVSDLYSGSATTINYRVWWGYNERVYHMDLQRDIVNPSQVPEFAYAEDGYLETPWFDAFQTEVDKLALQLKIEVQDASSDETVQVQYRTNYGEGLTNLGTVTSDGTTTYSFPDSTTPIGTEFRSIQFKITLARTDGVANKKKTPDVVSMVLVYRKKLEARWGHQVHINLNQEYRGRNSQELRSALVTAIEKSTLSEFTFRDDTGGTRNYYVDVRAATGIEYTGYDERGSTSITLVEP